MVKINCVALPSNLIESELFGHEHMVETIRGKKTVIQTMSQSILSIPYEWENVSSPTAIPEFPRQWISE